MRRFLVVAVSVGLFLLAARAFAAEPMAVARAISRHEAVSRGASLGPGVALASAPREAVAELGKRAYGLLRPPTLTLGGGYRSGSLTPGVELSVSVAQEVPLAGVGRARSNLAKALARSVDSDAKRAHLEGASRAASAWIEALYAKELWRLRQEGLRHAEAILKTTWSRVQVGVAPPHELALAEGEASAALAAVLDAEGTQVEALAELRFSIGAPAAQVIEPTGDLYESDEGQVDESSALQLARTRNLNLQLAVARAQQAANETRLSVAVLGPSLSLGASYVREGTGDKVLLGFVGLPIPVFDAAGFEAARQRGAQAIAEAQVELTRAEVARDIRLALHDRHHWREVRDALRSGALSSFNKAFRLAQTQYEVGTAEIGTVILARQRLLGVQEQLAQVASRVQLADIAVLRATGALLEEVTP